MKNMGWPLYRVYGRGGDRLSTPFLDVLRKYITSRSVEKYWMRELKEDVEKYTKKTSGDGDVVIGGQVMKMIPVDWIDENVFSCGVKDEWGELRYVVNDKFLRKGITVDVVVETGDNLDCVSRMAKCIVHFKGFYRIFKRKYEKDFSRLNMWYDVTCDGRELVISVDGPSPAVYGAVELVVKEYSASRTKCSKSFVRCGREGVRKQISEIKRDGHRMLYLEVTRMMKREKFGTEEVLEAVERIEHGDELVKMSRGHMRVMVCGNTLFSEAVGFYERIRGYLGIEGIGRMRMYPVDDDGKWIPGGSSVDVEGIICVPMTCSDMDYVGVVYNLGPAADARICCMGIIIGKLLGRWLEGMFMERIGCERSVEVKEVDNGCTLWISVSGGYGAEDMHRIIERFMKNSTKKMEYLNDSDDIEGIYDEYSGRCRKIWDLRDYSIGIFKGWRNGWFDMRRDDEILCYMEHVTKKEIVEFWRGEKKRIVGYGIGEERCLNRR